MNFSIKRKKILWKGFSLKRYYRAVLEKKPSKQISEFGTSFTYNLNTTDFSGIDKYWINNTDEFQIDINGIITNTSFLPIDEFWVEISVNDTVGNVYTSIIKISVQDATSPIWHEIPSDQILEHGTSFIYDLNATDFSGIDSYWINGTLHFQIDNNGIITNATNLSKGNIGLKCEYMILIGIMWLKNLRS